MRKARGRDFYAAILGAALMALIFLVAADFVGLVVLVAMAA